MKGNFSAEVPLIFLEPKCNRKFPEFRVETEKYRFLENEQIFKADSRGSNVDFT